MAGCLWRSIRKTGRWRGKATGMAVANGINVYIAEHVANLGTNTFVLHQFEWGQSFETDPKRCRRNQPIWRDDYEFLEGPLSGYRKIAAWWR